MSSSWYGRMAENLLDVIGDFATDKGVALSFCFWGWLTYERGPQADHVRKIVLANAPPDLSCKLQRFWSDERVASKREENEQLRVQCERLFGSDAGLDEEEKLQ